jgi:hypothetical protein
MPKLRQVVASSLRNMKRKSHRAMPRTAEHRTVPNEISHFIRRESKFRGFTFFNPHVQVQFLEFQPVSHICGRQYENDRFALFHGYLGRSVRKLFCRDVDPSWGVLSLSKSRECQRAYGQIANKDGLYEDSWFHLHIPSHIGSYLCTAELSVILWRGLNRLSVIRLTMCPTKYGINVKNSFHSYKPKQTTESLSSVPRPTHIQRSAVRRFSCHHAMCRLSLLCKSDQIYTSFVRCYLRKRNITHAKLEGTCEVSEFVRGELIAAPLIAAGHVECAPSRAATGIPAVVVALVSHCNRKRSGPLYIFPTLLAIFPDQPYKGCGICIVLTQSGTLTSPPAISAGLWKNNHATMEAATPQGPDRRSESSSHLPIFKAQYLFSDRLLAVDRCILHSPSFESYDARQTRRAYQTRLEQ